MKTLYRPRVVNNKLGDLGSDIAVNRLLTVVKPSVSAVAAPRWSVIEHFLL